MAKQPTSVRQIPHFNKYVEPTVALVLSLLADAYEDEEKLDKILNELSEDVYREVKKELQKLEKNGKINLDERINLSNNPSLYATLKHIEQEQFGRFVDYIWIATQVIRDNLAQSYRTTLNKTYEMFNYGKGISTTTGEKSLNAQVQITDTYFTNNVLNIPWCQDGKIYSQRIYDNVSQFQQKLNFVLEEGVTKGKGLDWMIDSWRKLTGSTAYDAARLLKTETMAMWSRATKTAYLEMGIEYVEIVGDAECGGICLDYVGGDAIPLAEAELGDELPPYHPNCACSYVAYEETEPAVLDEEE